MKIVIAMIASLAASSVCADAIKFKVPSDPKARYTIIERTGTGKIRQIVTKREGPSGASYSKREYDCQAATVRYIGTGDSLAEMRASKPDKRMAPVVDESIASYVGGAACEGYNPYKTLRSK